MVGTVTRRGKKSWRLKWELPREGDGDRQTRYMTYRGTKVDAEKELAKVIASLSTGGYVDPNTVTTGDLLTRWLNDVAKPSVEKRTFEFYTLVVNSRLIPVIGKVRLTALHTMQIQKLYADLGKDGRHDGEGGKALHPRSIKHTHKVLYAALKKAVLWKLIVRNPAEGIKLPKVKNAKMTTLTPEELAKLLEAAKGTRLYIPVLLAGMVGLRQGEVLGLHWNDVDLVGTTASIRYSVTVPESGPELKSAKSDKSRTVALPTMVVTALLAHKLEAAAIANAMGDNYIGSGLVCPSTTGGIWDPKNFAKPFRALTKKLADAGTIPRVKFHELRHTHITHLLQANVHPKIASERAGHSSVAITMDIYSHVTPNNQQQAAETVDKLMQAALAPKPAENGAGANRVPTRRFRRIAWKSIA